jgi:Protein of unknown function (DUF1681)
MKSSLSYSLLAKYQASTRTLVRKQSPHLVTVFKVPPLRSNEGYRATEWGDLAQPMWKGRMRIVETSKGVTIRLEDGQTGSLRALPARL